MKARCMKCKDQKEMKNAKISKTSRGGFMAKGNCESCNGSMCKILSSNDAEKAIKEGKAKKDY